MKYEGGEALGTPITLQGEKITGNNKVISKAGGSFSVSSVFDYIPCHEQIRTVSPFLNYYRKKTIEIPEIKVADGVIATEALANALTAAPTVSQDKFQRIIKEAHEASILFLIQQATLRKSELKSDAVTDLSKQFDVTAKDANKQIAGIDVSSYASPDGSVSLNESLASNREKATVGYLQKELKKAKAKGSIDAKFTAEDWDGFKEW